MVMVLRYTDPSLVPPLRVMPQRLVVRACSDMGRVMST